MAIAVALVLPACSAGSPGTAPSGSGPSPSGSPGGSLCADLAEATTMLPPLFDRIVAGTEPTDGFGSKVEWIDRLSRAIYADAASLATNGHDRAFGLVSQLSTDMSHLGTQEFQEFPATAPANVPRPAITAVRADLSAVRLGMVRGVIPCGGVAN